MTGARHRMGDLKAHARELREREALERKRARKEASGTFGDAAELLRLEGEFIAGLGRHSGEGAFRLDLLLGYRKALDRRTDWGALHRESVLDLVDRAIEAERRLLRDGPG